MFCLILPTLLIYGCGGGGGGGGGETPVATVTLDTIELSSEESVIAKGTSTQLSATGLYSDASIQDLTSTVSWSVDNDAILSVDSTGLLTGLTTGTTTVTATFDTVQNSIDITISPATLDTIELRSEESVVAKGTSTQLSATGLYSDASIQDLTSTVSWSVDADAILSVDSTGLLTGLTAGSTTVTAASGAVQNSINITISPATLTSLTLSPKNPTVALGTSLQLSVSGLFSDGTTQDLTTQSTWGSSDLAVATFDTPGLLSALSQGSATISVINGTISGNTSLTVSPATLSQIEINLTKSEIALGTGIQAEAIGLFSDNTVQTLTGQVTWSSSDDAVATVSNQAGSAGWIESVTVGTIQLSALYSGVTGSTAFEVKGAQLTSIDITPTELSMAAGLTENFTATGRYSDGSVQDLTALAVWQSSNSSVATIENSSGHHGEVASLVAGLSTISATFDGLSGNTALTITPALLQSISLDVTSSSVAAGLKIEFQATGHYSDGATADLTEQATWLSADESVVSSDPSIGGLFISQAAGDAIITASVDDILGFHFFTVTPATLVSIVIDQATPTIALGTQLTFTATGHYSDATTQDISNTVTWQSSDPDTATISNSDLSYGETQGLLEGSTTITAHFESMSDTTTLNITAATLSSITLSGSGANLVDGSTMSLQATANFSDSSTQDFTQFVTWSSSAEEIASISNKEGERGLVTGIAVGSAQLSAQFDGLSAATPYDLTIVSDPDAPISLALSVEPNVILNNGSDSTTLSVTLQPTEAAGTIADGTVVEFEISEGNTVTNFNASTTDGTTSIPLSSTYSGMISIKATVQGLTVNSTSSLYSTDNFSTVIGKAANMSPDYDNGTYRIGSWFGLYMRNYSNREFDVLYYQINNGGVLISETYDPAFLSDGTLTAGESAGVVYILDALDGDQVDNGISASYLLQDAATAAPAFGFSVTYSVN
ncbi:MAG: Ig-like domain-containing protein [Candidatus Polarisedimenticolaceae bacterium]|nr:Ig-like domain-containing protein [Candidatus Polarisedimenticolaceae bacterium]